MDGFVIILAAISASLAPESFVSGAACGLGATVCVVSAIALTIEVISFVTMKKEYTAPWVAHLPIAGAAVNSIAFFFSIVHLAIYGGGSDTEGGSSMAMPTLTLVCALFGLLCAGVVVYLSVQIKTTSTEDSEEEATPSPNQETDTPGRDPEVAASQPLLNTANQATDKRNYGSDPAPAYLA